MLFLIRERFLAGLFAAVALLSLLPIWRVHFVPTVDGWAPDLSKRAGLPVFIVHGEHDPIIDVAFARRARELLDDGGLDVQYRVSPVGHEIDPHHVAEASRWIARMV